MHLKCGFKIAGRYRERIFKKGKYVDLIILDILKSEWKEHNIDPCSDPGMFEH